MRETGLTYKELEQQGVYLAVSEISVRYRAAARYGRPGAGAVLVRELASRRVTSATRSSARRRASYSPPARHHSSPHASAHAHAAFPAHVIDLLKPFPIPRTCKTLMLSIVIVTTPRFRFNS